MKRKFNLLSIIVFVVLIINFIGGCFYAGLGFYEGFNEGIKASHNQGTPFKSESPVMVQLLPSSLVEHPEYVTNTVDGKPVKAQMTQGVVWLDKDVMGGIPGFISTFCAIISTVLTLLVMWHFIRFIKNINRQEIFTWKNVNLLETMGGLLIAASALNLIYSWIQCYMISQAFAVEGRIIDWLSPLCSSNIILGVLACIIGEVFAMGLRLREDQELTI